MKHQNIDQQKKIINRGVYGLLTVVVFIFLSIITVIEFQDDESEQYEILANKYHLNTSEKSLKILATITDLQLWFRNYYIDLKDEKRTGTEYINSTASLVNIRLSPRDKISAFKYEIEKCISEIGLIQSQFKNTTFKTINLMLEKRHIKVKSDFDKLKSSDFISYQNIDTIINPLTSVTDQLYRLHKQKYQEIRLFIEKNKRENLRQIVALIFLLIVIGLVSAIRMLRYIRHTLLELSKVNEEIEYSQARFESMFESLSDAVIVTDINRNMSLLNDSVLKMFGYSKDELVGNKTTKLYANVEDFKQTGIRRYNVNAKGNPLPYEIEYRRKDGSVFWGETLGAKITSSEGVIFGFVGIIRDITLRKHNEEEIKNLNKKLDARVKDRTKQLEETLFSLKKENEQRKIAEEQAKKASAAKSDFLSHMSHELRTPMNAILGFGQLLERDAKQLTEIQNSNVKEILDAGNHLLNLINGVLDLSKIESGKIDVLIDEVSIDHILKQSISLIRPLAEERKLDLIDNISGNGYLVKADETHLKQVLLNLLSNAVKYNCESGTISLTSEVIDNKRLCISVADKGKGLSDDDIQHLFKPFERLNVIGNIEGTGIGLVITKHLIELMGGSIGIESKVGGGSTFWIELELLNENRCQSRMALS